MVDTSHQLMQINYSFPSMQQTVLVTQVICDTNLQNIGNGFHRKFFNNFSSFPQDQHTETNKPTNTKPLSQQKSNKLRFIAQYL